MIALSFLTPKKDVQFLYQDFTIRQALEKMEFHRYGTIPVIERATGRYLYSLSEGDFLWYLKDRGFSLRELQQKPLSEVSPSRDILPSSVNAEMDDLYSLAVQQNFVPILDDLGVFIGIVTRKRIMCAYREFLQENEASESKE